MQVGGETTLCDRPSGRTKSVRALCGTASTCPATTLSLVERGRVLRSSLPTGRTSAGEVRDHMPATIRCVRCGCQYHLDLLGSSHAPSFESGGSHFRSELDGATRSPGFALRQASLRRARLSRIARISRPSALRCRAAGGERRQRRPSRAQQGRWTRRRDARAMTKAGLRRSRAPARWWLAFRAQ